MRRRDRPGTFYGLRVGRPPLPGTQATSTESCIGAPLRGAKHQKFVLHLIVLVFWLGAVYIVAVTLALLFDATLRLAARRGYHLAPAKQMNR